MPYFFMQIRIKMYLFALFSPFMHKKRTFCEIYSLFCIYFH